MACFAKHHNCSMLPYSSNLYFAYTVHATHLSQVCKAMWLYGTHMLLWQHGQHSMVGSSMTTLKQRQHEMLE
jgi:hypothetical protein